MMPLLTRRQLELLNRKSLKYPLDTAEKDYFLALALKLIYESELGDRLVFKGGTALHHCYFPQYRFSEDLDFTALDREIQPEHLGEILEAPGLFEVRKVYQSPFTFKLQKLRYQGVLGQAGSIKIEVDSTQNVVLPAMPRPHKNVWRVEVLPTVMDVREICAEKIRACSSRARYRDFYDLYWLLTERELALDEIVTLVGQKEVRSEISPEAMVKNWRVARQQRSRDLRNIHCSRPLQDSQIQELITQFSFTAILPW